MMLPILALSGWVLYGGGAGADLVSTEIALSRPGVHEGNPLGQTLAARLALKGACTPLLVWADHKLGKKRVIMRILYIGGMAWVVQHNLRVKGKP